MKRIVKINGELVEYSYQKKNTLRAYIRINRDAEISVTIPAKATFAQIEEFIASKYDWIKQKQQEIAAAREKAPIVEGQDVLWTLYLGEKYPVKISLSRKVLIRLHDGALDMQLTLPAERIDIPATIDGWRKFTARFIYQEMINKFFPHFASLGYKMPTLRVKRMSSRWGSYSRRTHAINMNSELLKAPAECIEFVIMHELCHLKHLDHSKNFYSLFTSLMPDHKAREQRLRDFYKSYGI